MDASCNLISVIMFFSFFLGLSRFSFTVTVIDKLSSKLKIFLMIIIRCSCTRNFFLLTQKLTWLLTPRLCVGCCPLWGFMVCDFAVHELQVWGASSDTPWDTVPLCGCWWCPGNHSLCFFLKKETILLFLVSWRVVYACIFGIHPMVVFSLSCSEFWKRSVFWGIESRESGCLNW